MSATNTQPKQIGDHVKITGGQNKNQIGILINKDRRGWIVELEDGSQVTVPFPMVALIEGTPAGEAAAQEPETVETDSVEATEGPAAVETPAETLAEEPAQEAETAESETEDTPETQATPTVEDAEDDTPDSAGGETEEDTTPIEAEETENESPDPADDTTEEDAANIEDDSSDVSPDIAKMTVRQLWALAKERGVSVARTKADFFRIIKAMNPDEDLVALKGKALFDRVGELHISRLRSKEEMARLLSN